MAERFAREARGLNSNSSIGAMLGGQSLPGLSSPSYNSSFAGSRVGESNLSRDDGSFSDQIGASGGGGGPLARRGSSMSGKIVSFASGAKADQDNMPHTYNPNTSSAAPPVLTQRGAAGTPQREHSDADQHNINQLPQQNTAIYSPSSAENNNNARTSAAAAGSAAVPPAAKKRPAGGGPQLRATTLHSSPKHNRQQKHSMVRDFVDNEVQSKIIEGGDGDHLASSENPNSANAKRRVTTTTNDGHGSSFDATAFDTIGGGGEGGSAMRRMNSNMTGIGAASHDSSDDEGGLGGVGGGGAGDGSKSLDSGSSGSTKDSNSMRIKAIQARPMTLIMILLMAIPLSFLIAYQSISVANSQATYNFMHDHAPSVRHMIDLHEALQDEMIVVSELIGLRISYGISGEAKILPSWVPIKLVNDTMAAERYFTETRTALHSLIHEVTPGNGAGALDTFHSRALDLPEKLAQAEVAAARNDGPLYRKTILFVTTELSTMIATLQQNEHARDFSIELVDLQLIIRLEETFVKLFAIFVELGAHHNESVSFLVNNATTQSARCLEFASGMAQLDGFVDYLEEGSGNAVVTAAVQRFWGVGTASFKAAYAPFVECDFTKVVWPNATMLNEDLHTERKRLVAVVIALLDEIANNDAVQQRALVEGMKMMGAIIASTIGVIIVVLLQNHERSELFMIINHSQRLAEAVRRFVPRRQLRIMGVQSVLQVEPGMSTEVAQCMVFSDIRGYTKLSEAMSRDTLFDWLQSYIATMTAAVSLDNGTVQSFLGDGLFITFPQAADGVTGAIRMQQEVLHMNVDIVGRRDTDTIQCGIGIHFGVVVCGCVGSQERLTVTLVSSDVNLAARIEGLTKVYGCKIMMSRAVVNQLHDHNFEIRRLGKVFAAGSHSGLEIFDLYQADSELVKKFKNETLDVFHRCVELAESEVDVDRKDAMKLIMKLQQKAEQMRVVDQALYVKMKEARRAEVGSPVRMDKHVLEKAEAGESISFS